MTLRLGMIVVLLGVLWAIGAIHPEDLPWGSGDFQISGVTVLLYILWSASETRARAGGSSSPIPFAVLYAVLLVSAVDGFLLRLTTYEGPLPLRWGGAALFAAGSVVRLRAIGISDVRLLRIGRLLQIAGLPVSLGSIAGTVTAALLGVPGSIREELPVPPDTIEAPEQL